MGLENPSATSVERSKVNFDLSTSSVIDLTSENQHQSQSQAPYWISNTSGSRPASISSDSSLPITIDLTGPLPVISVLKRDGKGGYIQSTISNRSERFYNKLITEAPQVSIKSLPSTEIEESLKDVSDINRELVKEGKLFIQRNFFAIIFAHLVAIAFLLGVKPIQALLLRTGAIHRKENTLKRYLSLISVLKNLYKCDLLVEQTENANSPNSSVISDTDSSENKPNPESKTEEELSKLRKLGEKLGKNFRIYVPPPTHLMKLDKDEETLLKAVQADLVNLNLNSNEEIKREKIFTTVNPDVPLSQYDLAIAQFTFIGFISLFPKIFGIHETEEKFPDGFKGFVHIWAILGKRLGLEDRFNLCLEKNFDERTNEKIFREVFLFSFKIVDENLLKLWRSMVSGSWKYFYFFGTKSMVQFMMRNVGGIKDCKGVYELMNYWEKWSYKGYKFCLSWLLKYWITRSCVNYCAKGVFYLGEIYLRRISCNGEKSDSQLIVVKNVS